MWVAKIKLYVGKKGMLGNLAQKHNITLTGYPISYTKIKNEMRSFLVGNLIGDEKNKKAFLRDLKKEKTFASFEKQGDFLISLLKIKPDIQPLYDPFVIHVRPSIISPDGYQISEIASFERKHLEKIIAFVAKKLKGELITIKREKIAKISLTGLAPKITEKQKKAFELAIKKGYYDYPRKIDLKELAKISGIAFSAFHGHLRKAEKILLPYAYNTFSQ